MKVMMETIATIFHFFPDSQFIGFNLSAGPSQPTPSGSDSAGAFCVSISERFGEVIRSIFISSLEGPIW